MRRILFIDPVCPKPYSAHTLDTEALGGTEATVVRVAEKLAIKYDAVLVEQQGRTEAAWFHGAQYVVPGAISGKMQAVVVLRDPSALLAARERFPDARLYLWLHDVMGADIVHAMGILESTKTTIVCVSNFHRTHTIERLRSGGYDGTQFQVKRIYNPIDDSLRPDPAVPVDKNKLVFFSSPHKGLERTLDVFTHARRFLPDLTLSIANPGYYRDRDVRGIDGVVCLGPLAHRDVLSHVRSSLAVFHLNDVFPETFGLVYAEANAVGTPFLGHQLGAINEVSDHPSQIVNVKDNEQVIKRLVSWHQGSRPLVRGNHQFRCSEIAREWIRLLD